jgi:AbrB family looped-hinge helix DNA binding protein
MRAKRVTVGPGGRVVIPAEFRKSLGVRAGDQVVVDLKDDDVRVRSLDAVVERAQAQVRQYVPDDVSLAEELIEDRRGEAAREVEDEGSLKVDRRVKPGGDNRKFGHAARGWMVRSSAAISRLRCIRS